MLNLLTILFVGLKLTGHIDWSWFFVILPTIVQMFITGVVVLYKIGKKNKTTEKIVENYKDGVH